MAHTMSSEKRKKKDQEWVIENYLTVKLKI